MDKIASEVIETGAIDMPAIATNLNDAELLLVGGGCAESTPY